MIPDEIKKTFFAKNNFNIVVTGDVTSTDAVVYDRAEQNENTQQEGLYNFYK